MPVEAVGAHLRDMRERRGISLDEIARQTRVPFRYLEALEADHFADLPAPVFVRGFIRAYCQALGEPAEQVLARLDGRGSVRPAVRTATAAVRAAPAAPGRRAEARSRTRAAVLVSLTLLVGLGGALFSLAMVIHPRDDRRPAEVLAEPYASEGEQASPAPAPALDGAPPPGPIGATPALPVPPPSPPAPKASPVASPPSAVAPVRPEPAPPPPAPGETQTSLESAYRLVARTTEATWIRVRTEEGRTTEETLPPGAVREWVSSRPFVLTVGNAGGLLLELNGTELPPLGASGAVISRLVIPAQPR